MSIWVRALLSIMGGVAFGLCHAAAYPEAYIWTVLAAICSYTVGYIAASKP